MPGRIELIKGDITQVDADAIVNAANTRLLGGGGVDGAIHKAAGPELLEECKKLNGCETGQSKITNGYKLTAVKVIHTVGPVWRGGSQDEHMLLASCYQSALGLAKKNKLKTVAFPCISTGAYRFPREQAALIAINETKRFLERNPYPEKVIFVTYDDQSHKIYSKLLSK